MDLRERPSQEARRHPWERSRMRLFRRVLLEEGLFDGPLRWLDAGAGDGWLANHLFEREARPSSELLCWDSFYSDAELRSLSEASPPGVRFAREAPEARFGLITALDVIEHVEDDRAFLAGLVERLAPDGTLLLSVPAWQALFSGHDRRLLHFRRYEPRAIRRLFEEAGLRITRSGGAFHSLLPVRAAQKAAEFATELARASESGSEGSQEPPSLAWRGPGWLAEAVEGALELDNRLSLWASRRGRELPGLAWWGVAKRA